MATTLAAVPTAPAAQAAAAVPPSRYGHAMAADPATGKLVLFSGESATRETFTTLDDTWTWNGTRWKKQSPPTHPSYRFGASMAGDRRAGNVVLFGGNAFVLEGDDAPTPTKEPSDETWTWDGVARTWTKQAPPLPTPPGRSYATMAYDKATGTVVMFGGLPKGQQVTLMLNDTWTWDGVARQWTLKTPPTSPPARQIAAMAYDAKRKKAVLFGGSDSGRVRLGDTWTWDGVTGTWTQMSPPTSPSPRYDALMTYDAARQRIVLFGGRASSSVPLTDTWTWDGTTWTQQAPAASPAPTRASAAMAYHVPSQKTVLFGGATVVDCCVTTLNDTWTYGTTWKKRT